MSVDPSAIPNFGSTPDKQGQARKPAGPIMPNQDLVKQLLDRMKVKYVEDKQGDLIAPWKHFRVHFMFRGDERQRMLIVRSFYDRPHGMDDKPRLLESADEWNRTSLWPKAYTYTNDEGEVRLIGDFHLLLGAGVGFDHFVACVVSWVRAAVEFDKWMVERLGLEQDEDEDDAAAEDADDLQDVDEAGSRTADEA